MTDRFVNTYDQVDGPAKYADIVTPSDSANLTTASRSLYIGNGGNVNVVAIGSSANALFQNVPSGTILPVRTQQIWNTGTTANGIIALY